MPPEITVVVGNYQGERLLGDCLGSLREQTRLPAEALVVDAGSSDRSVAVTEELGGRVLRRENRGLGYLYNEGAKAAATPYVMLVNNDVALDRRCLEQLIDAHQSGARDHSAPLWTLLMFEAFLRNAHGSAARAAPPPAARAEFALP